MGAVSARASILGRDSFFPKNINTEKFGNFVKPNLLEQEGFTLRGVSKLLSTTVKLGADVSIAAGPVGAGVRGKTAGLSADIVSFARSKGLYAGISFEGAVVATRDALNKAYYGKAVTPTDILVRREVSNPQAAGLVRSVAEVAGRK